MGYDLFISYCHEDLVWAEKLERALTSLGLSVFRDSTTIRAGQDWPSAVRTALDDSRALVLLWSDDHASASSWVHFEAARFDARQGAGLKLQVCLKGSYPPFHQLQTIPDIDAAGAYAKGSDNVDLNVWTRVIDRIESAIGFNDPVPVVHQVILASTRERMEELMKAQPRGEDTKALLAVLDQLKLSDKLLDRYGSCPAEWSPFAGKLTIQALLSAHRAAMLERNVPPFRWCSADKLWNATGQERERYVEKLYKEPCLVAIDALSLYDAKVRTLCDFVLDECLSNEAAAVMVLPPSVYPDRDYLRDAIENVAAKLFKQVYREFREAKLPKAHCNLLVPDEQEISRLVAAVVRSSNKHMALRLK